MLYGEYTETNVSIYMILGLDQSFKKHLYNFYIL